MPVASSSKRPARRREQIHPTIWKAVASPCHRGISPLKFGVPTAIKNHPEAHFFAGYVPEPTDGMDGSSLPRLWEESGDKSLMALDLASEVLIDNDQEETITKNFSSISLKDTSSTL